MINRSQKIRLFLFGVCCITLILLGNAASNAMPIAVVPDDKFTVITFSENILLSTKDNVYPHHVETTLAISANGTIFAGWKDSYSHNGGGARVSFSRSVDNGLTWTEPFYMPMFAGQTGQSDPWLTWSDPSKTLYYAYLEYDSNFFDTHTGLSQITVAKSTDYGKTWTPVRATYGEGFADKETMTVSKDGIVYVTYNDFVPVGSYPDDYYYNVSTRITRSTDGGDTYEEINILSVPSADSSGNPAPYVKTDSNNNVFVALAYFTEYYWGDVYIANSSDKGETFSEFRDINSESQNASGQQDDDLGSRLTLPTLYFDQNDRMYVLWAGRYEEGGLWDCYIRYSDDYGQTWSERYRVNPDITGDQWHPEMTIDGFDRCHVVWYGMNAENTSYKPYYRMIEFPAGGEPIFGNTLPIADTATDSSFTRPGEYFAIRFDSANIPHIVWSDGRNNEMDVYYAYGILNTPVTTEPTTQTSESSPVTTTQSSTPTLNLVISTISLVIITSIIRKRKQ